MKIAVVGGGSAGWITLSYLAAATDAELVIIHSNEVDTIGVGESTTPTIKHVADTIGVDEQEWMRDAKAYLKYGVEFHNWNKIGSRWLHSFDDMLPHQTFHRPITEYGKEQYEKDLTSVEYFLKAYGQDVEFFNRTHGPQEHLLENKISPFDKNYKANLSRYPGYSYHINAFQFGESLKKHTSKDRYTEIVDTIVDVDIVDNNLKSVKTQSGETIEADIFFDATGFHKLLISHFSEWQPYEDLVNDRAIWGPFAGVQTYKPCTEAHAMPYGWLWIIPTYNQLGTGYVYSSKYQSDEDALQTITDFWKERGRDFQPIKQISFNAGIQKNVSVGNVISTGLSQSFIEPLEATSIMVTCVTVKSFVDVYNKNKQWTSKNTQVHDKVMKRFINHTKKFVHFHYKLSERDDTPYWRDVANDPNAVKDVCDYIDVLADGQWLSKGETLLNQWNWLSMLLGYDKKYINDLPEISEEHLENYKHYTDLLIQNYKHIVRNNLTIQEYLDHINQKEL